MKAFTKYQYGGPEVLQLEEIPDPIPTDEQLLIRVKANSANPADWHILRGEPFFARVAFGLITPKEPILGADFAGIVEAVGSKVTGFKKGDRVFGESLKAGSFANYVCAAPQECAHMPETASFRDMAALPIAGLTALQSIVTHGKVKSGEKVLINGASGGVGHLAVQIAKAQGASVTGVCSAAKVDFVKELGADEVIAYDEEDIHQHQGSYDMVLDTHGNLDLADYIRMGKRGVVIGFTTMGHLMGVMLRNIFKRFPLQQFTAAPSTEDLHTLAQMVESGQLAPHIERTYPYQDIPKAIAYIEQMKTRGKVTMVWED